MAMQLVEKPECRCSIRRVGIKKVADSLLYGLFNPYHSISRISPDIDEMVQNRMPGDTGLRKSKEERERAWEELKDMLETGKVKPEELTTKQVIDNFFYEILEELYNLGYIAEKDAVPNRRVVRFTAKAEKVLGEKVLALSLQNLERRNYGENITEKEGVSNFPSEKLVEFDPFLHSFDVIDIAESLLKSATRGKIEINENEMVVRQPKHVEKCVYVMLIDVSDSMRGSRKMVGALEAAVGLRRAIEKKKSNDELHIIAFSHKAKELKQGEILNVEVGGATDIGLALKKARRILERSSGTGIVFLITDGIPTSSDDPDLTPWMSTLKEAEKLQSVDARLQIIVLGTGGKVLELCEKIAKKNGKASVVHIPDPLDLKRYVVRSYWKASYS